MHNIYSQNTMFLKYYITYLLKSILMTHVIIIIIFIIIISYKISIPKRPPWTAYYYLIEVITSWSSIL